VRKILLTLVGTLSIATAVIAAVTAAAGYSQARILEPGSRGNVIEI
jgi:hypothetical protein